MSKRIGVLGGTFDPIHLGHLHLAEEVAEIKNLDEVWFCPAGQNPFKDKAKASIEDRLKMVSLAIEDYPNFKLIDIEAHQKGPSFTVDTLRRLKNGGDALYLIISDELLVDFFRWKEAREIVKIAHLIVGSRLKTPEFPVRGDPKIMEALKKGLITTSLTEVSATSIRERLKEGRSCHRMLPPPVLSYILANKLYQSWPKK